MKKEFRWTLLSAALTIPGLCTCVTYSAEPTPIYVRTYTRMYGHSANPTNTPLKGLLAKVERK